VRARFDERGVRDAWLWLLRGESPLVAGGASRAGRRRRDWLLRSAWLAGGAGGGYARDCGGACRACVRGRVGPGAALIMPVVARASPTGWWVCGGSAVAPRVTSVSRPGDGGGGFSCRSAWEAEGPLLARSWRRWLGRPTSVVSARSRCRFWFMMAEAHVVVILVFSTRLVSQTTTD